MMRTACHMTKRAPLIFGCECDAVVKIVLCFFPDVEYHIVLYGEKIVSDNRLIGLMYARFERGFFMFSRLEIIF